MNLIIYSKNIQLTDSIKSYIHEKIGRIEQFFEEPIDTNVHVNVFILKNKHCVEISIPLNATFIRAEAYSNDLYQSIDIAEEKMKRQLRKYKTKLNRKPRQDLNIPKETHDLEKPTKPQKKNNQGLPMRFYKPMNAEEAILQMELFNLKHLYFFDDISNELRAVFKRKDGKYGLITPNQTEMIDQVG